MTLQQLEYLVAIDEHRHFARAAASCHVTQPTLSMQLRKLEDELGFSLFLRNTSPLRPTAEDVDILQAAREVLQAANRLHGLAEEARENALRGVLRLGLIPTIAPYLLPLFLPSFRKAYPEVQLELHELTTKDCILGLKQNRLDAAILVTPLHEPKITELPFAYEPLAVYAMDGHKLLAQREVSPEDLSETPLTLLSNSHCLRSQVLSLCPTDRPKAEVALEAGSVLTLLRLTEMNHDATLLPALAVRELHEEGLDRVRFFKSPEPVRELSLIHHQSTARPKLIKAVHKILGEVIPKDYRSAEGRRVLELSLDEN